MEDRYINNIDEFLTEELQKQLLNTTFAVLGAGGNGGYIIEMLMRLGVSKIILFDGDNFTESNLNRQFSCTLKTIGLNKAETVALYCQDIADTPIEYYTHYFGEKAEDLDIILSANFIFDEMDYHQTSINPKVREYLRAALVKGIPIACGRNAR